MCFVITKNSKIKKCKAIKLSSYEFKEKEIKNNKEKINIFEIINQLIPVSKYNIWSSIDHFRFLNKTNHWSRIK